MFRSLSILPILALSLSFLLEANEALELTQILDEGRKAPKRIASTPEQITASKKINYLIIIFQENWSFDALYGKFPGGEGVASASSESCSQVDESGKPYHHLLPCINTETGLPYSQIPKLLPNQPFDLSSYIPMNQLTRDLVHDFYHEQFQINGGRMNQFATFSDAGGFALSYYDISSTLMGKLSKEYVLCDHWFHSCYGGSMCNVLWLFSAEMPIWPDAPGEIIERELPIAPLNKNKKEGRVSQDGYAINNAEPFYPPYSKGTPEAQRVPPQINATIGDRLSEKGISWGWYAEGWDLAVAGSAPPSFAFDHQAPVYFAQFAPGTAMRKEHLLDLTKFHEGLKNGNVPAVSFIRSIDRYRQHPGDGTLLDGLNWCANLIGEIQKSPIWKECAIIVAYDENGGRWDHLSPPIVDRFGPGTRVPAVIISPFAKRGYIDSTSYETVSILKFIEERWELAPLSSRDAAANNILNAFNL